MQSALWGYIILVINSHILLLVSTASARRLPTQSSPTLVRCPQVPEEGEKQMFPVPIGGTH